jgi:hypothetical protein
LSQFATSADHDDVRRLHVAAAGENLGTDQRPPLSARQTEGIVDGRAAVDHVLEMINAVELAHQIGVNVDHARATFVLPQVLVDSHEDFLATITAFYLHLLRHAQPCSGGDGHGRRRGPRRSNLVRIRHAQRRRILSPPRPRPFHGGRGGLRFVLDAMADHHKNELIVHRVQRVLKEADQPARRPGIASLSWMPSSSDSVPLLPEDVRARGASPTSPSTTRRSSGIT